MFDNNLYNLMNQLVEEHKSLWRIRDEYLEDAEGDVEALDFWNRMIEDKGAEIVALTELVQARLS